MLDFKLSENMSTLLFTHPELGYKITNLTGSSGTNRNLQISGVGYSFYYHYYPTNNCQLGSYGSLDSCLKASNWKEILISLQKELGPKTGTGAKPLMLADVKANAGCEEKIEELFKVMSKTPYKSSNGSNMILYMLDTREI